MANDLCPFVGDINAHIVYAGRILPIKLFYFHLTFEKNTFETQKQRTN